ncbi:putative transmembrane protein [Rhodopirellula islandica]|uniref:Transmembrane protein n=1 Tax=Rhodopirellula islandica TaxID=595434 RepID=A0A0J1B9J7_RHOIS|nr:putative transmembrane protein [Rhodopirellula islandica]
MLDCIDPVIRRMRRLRFWQSLGWLAWTIALIVLVWLVSTQRTFALLSSMTFSTSSLSSSIAIVSTLVIAALACLIAARLRIRNVQSVAREIEHRYPDLDQRLITAVDDSVAQHPDSYLNQRVMREAREHARRNNWPDVVSSRWLWVNRLFGLSGTLATLALAAFFLLAKPDTSATASSVVLPKPDVVIQPGSTEIERGTNLLVTAEFQADWIGRQSAVEPELVLTAIDHQPIEQLADTDQTLPETPLEPRVARLPMRRSMADPIWGGLVPEVDESFTYRVALPHWSSEEYRVEVFEYPAVSRSDAAIVYPEFTGLENRRIEDTVRVSVAKGSEVTWWVRLNKPVTSARLFPKPYKKNEANYEDSAPLEMTQDPERPLWWSVAIKVEESERYDVGLKDDKDRTNQLSTQFIVRMLPNQSAKIRPTIGGDVSVSALEEFLIAAEVRDDHGLARAGVSLTFAGKPPQDIVLAENIAANQKQTIQHMVDMESLEAKPDDLLSYSFWAEDKVASESSETNVRRTQSDLYFAEVRRFEEIFREGDPQASQPSEPSEPSEQEQQAEELIETQKQIIQATWKSLQSTVRWNEQTTADVRVIADSQQDVIAQLDELAQELTEAESKQHAANVRQSMLTAVAELNRAIETNDREPLSAAVVAEQSAYAGLLRMRASEFEVSRSQQQQQPSQGSAGQERKQQQLDELELDQEQDRYETQQQAQMTPEQQAQRETRQVLSRLGELARRQQDLNEELAQLQSALQLADEEQEKEELRRQLERLREQQQDMLRQTDELMERMNSPENASNMQEASEQLEQTRENIREAGEAMEQQDAATALSSGKRAERELESVREEIREQAAGQFNEAMQSMRDRARDLNTGQQEIEEQLSEMDAPSDSPGLRSSGSREELKEALSEQREALTELMEDIEEVVQEAEESEPLLAQNLYDAFRETQQRRAEERLDAASQLLQRGFDTQSQQMAGQAGDAIEELSEQIEAAAESVLGNEAEGLQRAANLAEQLESAVEDEVQQARSDDPNGAGQGGASETAEREPGGDETRDGQPGEGQPGQPGQPQPQPSEENQPGQGGPGQPQGEQPPGEQPPGESEGGQPTPSGSPSQSTSPGQGGAGQGGAGQGRQAPEGQTPAEPTQGEPAEGSEPQESSERPPGPPGLRPGSQTQPGQPQEGQAQPGESQSPSMSPTPGQPGGANPSAAQAPSSPSNFTSPLTGEGFREWSDGLRDIEEMVSDPELRSRATRIRERARDMREEIRRESKPPQWDLVEEMIVEPMRELKRDLAEEYMRRSAKKQSLVPIDRDPVPDQYSEAVRRYYERIGSGL